MEQDFHYYTVYHLSVLAGFSKSDAQTIADATESEPIRPFEDQYFDTARTAHYNLEGFTWKHSHFRTNPGAIGGMKTTTAISSTGTIHTGA